MLDGCSIFESFTGVHVGHEMRCIEFSESFLGDHQHSPDRLDTATSKGRIEEELSIPHRPCLTGWQGRLRRSSGGECGRTGGAVGPCLIAGGAVFQCRTLEWVVRNIPKKISTILINGLV